MRGEVIVLLISVISGSGLIFAQTPNADSPPTAEVIERQIKAMLSRMQSGNSHEGGTANKAGTASSSMDGMMGMHIQMERRLSMMEQLMQMMIDRESAENNKVGEIQ